MDLREIWWEGVLPPDELLNTTDTAWLMILTVKLITIPMKGRVK
jgi:hypothetical protein